MTRRFVATPERVFDAWTDPALAGHWLFTTPLSQSHHTMLDARVGASWRIVDVRGGITYTAIGQYIEVNRPHRLVFTFAMPQFSPNSDTITLDFAADGDGCIMTFTQSGTDIAAELDRVPEGEIGGSEHGWTLMFLALGQLAEQGRIDRPAEMLPGSETSGP
jgi:uncharacterized protein YndB with AHSA1/START domain